MSLFIGKKMEATLLEGIETEFRALKQICEME
jgi:hypothetical protein